MMVGMTTRLAPLLLTFSLMGFGPWNAVAQTDGEPVSMGTYRVLHSQLMGEDRVLQVHLPRGYEESTVDYPVLYLFYSEMDVYYGEAVHVLSLLSTNLMPQCILVGVTNVDRYRDLLPWSTADGWGGEADRFLRVLREELVPFIESEYRTKDYRIMVGPQAAGVFGAYALLQDPTLFQAFILNDPCANDSEDRSLCRRLSQFAGTPEANGHFFAVSQSASPSPRSQERLESIRSAFQASSAGGFRWRIDLDTEWAPFLPPIDLKDNLLTLFQGYPFPMNPEVGTLSDALSHYQALSERLGFPIDPPELVLSQMSDRLTGAEAFDEALEVLNHLISLYPASVGGYWRLANLHRERGDTAAAIRFYRECLNRDPNMDPARMWLERLGGHSPTGIGPGRVPDLYRQEGVALVSELEPLAPLLGNWIGRFDDPDETMEIHCTWAPILDGNAVRMVNTIEEAGFVSERTIYFDRAAESMAYVVITNNGYVSRGQMAFEGTLLVDTGSQTSPEGTVRQASGVWELMPDGTLENTGADRVEGRWVRSPTSHRMILTRR
jgi:tetratricopeptide (TPR) repeat protein